MGGHRQGDHRLRRAQDRPRRAAPRGRRLQVRREPADLVDLEKYVGRISSNPAASKRMAAKMLAMLDGESTPTPESSSSASFR